MDLSPETSNLKQPSSRSGSYSSADGQYDLGVLFVHGIGQQRRGITLTSFLDPLHRHLERLLTKDDYYQERSKLKWQIQDSPKEGRDRYEAELRRLDRLNALTFQSSALRQLPDDPAAPAHSILQVAARPEGDREESVRQDLQSTWCVAESWWADEFDAPEFGTFVRWALRVAPAIVISHFARSCYRSWRFDRRRPVYWWRLVGQPFLLVAAIPLSLLLSTVLFLLLLIGLLPIPKISGLVARIGTVLARSLGDSFILLESPVQFDAMVSRVSRDLDWLSRRCRTVTLVAHSQGAMISHHCLRRNRPSNLKLFVTVGSGLGKLHEIQDFRRQDTIASDWFLLFLFPFIVGLAAISLLTGDWTLFLLGGSLWLGLSLLGLYSAIWGEIDSEARRKEELWLEEAGKQFTWIDFWSSTDPVSNGPIFLETPPWLQSHETWNRASILFDHSGYLRNFDGFLAPLACELGKLAGGAVGARLLRQEDQVRAARRKRRWRVGCLFLARYVIFIAAFFAGVRLWTDVRDDVADRLSRTSPGLRGPIEDGTTWLNKAPFLSVTPASLTALLVITVTIVLIYTLMRWLWSEWERYDVDQFYQGGHVNSRGWGFGAFTGHACAAALALGIAGSTEAVSSYLAIDYAYAFALLVLCFTVLIGSFPVASHEGKYRMKKLSQNKPALSLHTDWPGSVENLSRWDYWSHCWGELLIVSEAILVVLCYSQRHRLGAMYSTSDLAIVLTTIPVGAFVLTLAWLVVRFVGSRLDGKVAGHVLRWLDVEEQLPPVIIPAMAPPGGHNDSTQQITSSPTD
jgi:hypothetical protein